jgi:hypothetical protein
MEAHAQLNDHHMHQFLLASISGLGYCKWIRSILFLMLGCTGPGGLLARSSMPPLAHGNYSIGPNAVGNDTTKQPMKYNLVPAPVIAVNPTTDTLSGTLLGPPALTAHDDTVAADDGGPEKKEKKVDITILPVIAANPTVGVVFCNTSTASSRTEDITLFDNMILGYGPGLRFAISEKKRVNLGLDYGFGANGAQGLFVNLNEYS